MIKQTIIDQIEVTRSGTIQIRMHKQIVDGEQLIASSNHRTAIQPGGDIDATAAVVNAHLDEMGWPAVDDSEWQRVKDLAVVAWG